MISSKGLHAIDRKRPESAPDKRAIQRVVGFDVLFAQGERMVVTDLQQQPAAPSSHRQQPGRP